MKLKKKLMLLSFLTFLTLNSTSIFATWDDDNVFEMSTFDENGIPTTGYFKDNRHKVQLTRDAQTFLLNNTGRDDTGGNLLYVRNGYGGGVSDPFSDTTHHQKSYSFSILMPFDAAGDTLYKQEDFSFKYIEENKTYRAGPSGQKAYGYPSRYNFQNKPNPYTLKLIQGNPKYGTFDTDFSGNILMTSMTSRASNPVLGEYRFNGISGNGTGINNPFFPNDIDRKVPSVPEEQIWNKDTVTAALTGKPCSKYGGQTLTLLPFEQNGQYLMGSRTFENESPEIAEHALDTYFDYFFHGGKSAAYAIRPWYEWNRYIKIDNSPHTGSAAYTIEFRLSGGGHRYNSMIVPSNQINDIAIKSIVVFDVDEEGNLIKKADGSYQTMAEFSRQESLISAPFGNQRVNAPLLAGKEYVVGVNIMNVDSKKTKTINFENNPKIADVISLNAHSVRIPEVEKVLKLPEEIKYITDSEGNDTLVREAIYGEWIDYRETMKALDWSKVRSNDFEYQMKINNVKMDDHRSMIDSITFSPVDKTSVGKDTSIAAGINSVDGGYNPDALIRTKGNGNAMIITAKVPIAPDYNSNKQNDIGWLIVPVAVNDMGMRRMVVKDPYGKIVHEGGFLDKDVEYTIDYIVEKVAGERKVENTTVLTKVISKDSTVPLTQSYYSSEGINRTDILRLNNTVPNDGSFKLLREIEPNETIKVCGEVSSKHTQKGENINNSNDFICQEFKGQRNDMSIVEIKLKDPTTGRYVTEVSTNKNYEAIFTVKKETGQKVVTPTIIDTTINGGNKTTNSTDRPLEPNKNVDIIRTIVTPDNIDRVEICGEIVRQHDTNGDNIRNDGDKLCKTFGKKLNFYVQNLEANPRQVILPSSQNRIPNTPFALSFKAGFESVANDTQTVQIIIRDYQNRIVWTGIETFVSGEEKNIVAPVVIGNVGLGNYQYTVEINPNRNPAEVIPNGDPYKDNKSSTSFVVARNYDCFQCYEKSTRIDWVLEYTTTVSPGEPYEYSYGCNWVSGYYNSEGEWVRGYYSKTCYAWACRKGDKYKTVDAQRVNFFEIYRFDQILFRSKYTEDNVTAMRAKGATISNDGWLDVLNLPSNLKKFVGIKSGYGFELKVLTYYDTNFTCDRDIPGPTVQCEKPNPDRETTPIDCWSASDSVTQIRYQSNSTNVPTGGFLPSYITPQTDSYIVCVEWPFKDDFGNTSKSMLDLTNTRNGRVMEVWRTYELPRRDVIKKGVFERKMYIHRGVTPNVVSGPTYTVNVQTNRKQGMYTPSNTRQGYLQDCFSFQIYIVGKMEEDMITHIMD